MTGAPFTVGVEEEYFLVDAETRALRPRQEGVLDSARARLGDRVEPELNLAQIEASTPIAVGLPEVHRHLSTLRTRLMHAATESGSRIAALGTHPFSEWLSQQITPKQRYVELDAMYQELAWEQLVCGCHVHVGVDDPELAIQVMNRVRPYLPTLRALTTNSPFWQGVDTGYASHRMSLSDRWPTAGSAPMLENRAAYDDLVDTLVRTGSVSDASNIYWDVRPSSRYPTLEFRVADVCLTVDEAVMVTGLARSLTRTAVHEVERDAPTVAASAELLRAARWRAARHGLEGTLIDVGRKTEAPAAAVVQALLDHLRDDLEQHDEWETVAGAVGAVLRHGTGSTRQRRVVEAGGNLRGVVDMAVAATISGIDTYA